MLAELTEIGMSMARELQARCRSAETADEVQVLMLAFQRVSRSVRLSLALRVRLERQRRELLRDDHVVALRRTDARKAQVRAVLTRDIYDESESCDVENLLDELDERLEEEALDEDFPHQPIDLCIARIRKGLGLPPETANDQAEPAQRITLSG